MSVHEGNVADSVTWTRQPSGNGRRNDACGQHPVRNAALELRGSCELLVHMDSVIVSRGASEKKNVRFGDGFCKGGHHSDREVLNIISAEFVHCFLLMVAHAQAPSPGNRFNAAVWYPRDFRTEYDGSVI
jgi:hypothetical protein